MRPVEHRSSQRFHPHACVQRAVLRLRQLADLVADSADALRVRARAETLLARFPVVIAPGAVLEGLQRFLGYPQVEGIPCGDRRSRAFHHPLFRCLRSRRG